MLTLGQGSGEPNVAVAPDGTIYVTPIDHVYRSDDGGATFTDLGTSQTKGHGDGDIAIDATGRIHWLGLFDGSNAIPYQFPDDRGESFSKVVDVSKKTGSDREWIDVTPDGHVYAAWRDGSQGYSFNTSPDGGKTWGDKVKVADDTLGGPIIHDTTQMSRLYIPAVDFSGVIAGGSPTQEAQIVVMISNDTGASWSKTVIASSRGSPGDIFSTSIFPVMAADRAGNLYLVISLKQDTAPGAAPKQGTQYGVYLYKSSDHGVTWGAPLLVSPSLKVAIMPWIAAGATGSIAITYYQNTLGLPNENLPDEWDVMLLEAVDADAGAPHFQAAKLTDTPNHIGAVCTSGTACLAGDRSMLDFFEVAIQPNGYPVAAWASSTAGTGIGLAVQGTDIQARAVTGGTSLI